MRFWRPWVISFGIIAFRISLIVIIASTGYFVLAAETAGLAVLVGGLGTVFFSDPIQRAKVSSVFNHIENAFF